MKKKELSVLVRVVYIGVLMIFLFSGSTTLHAQWLEGYLNRLKITIADSLVSGTESLVDFPFLFSYTDTRLRTESEGGKVQFSDGRDIVFTDKDSTTILDYEIESYDKDEGSVVAWIRLPELADAAPTELFLYYGKTGGSPEWNPPGVWSSHYSAVWHMGDDPSEDAPQFSDVTLYENHGTTGGNMELNDVVEGKIAEAVHFDGIDDYATMPDSGFNLAEGSVELWIYLDSLPVIEKDYFFAHRQEAPITDRVYLKVWVDGEWGSSMGANYDLVRGDTLETGTWYHLAVAWKDTAVTGYLDGMPNFGPIPYTGLDTVREILIMTWMPSSEAAKGILDELRVSRVARDSSWILASYRNQLEPEAYYQVEDTPPTNDLSCNALELDVGDSCEFTVHSNLGSTDSGIPDPGCGSYSGGDIWFYVVVPEADAFEIQTDTETEQQYPLNNGWMYRNGMAIYSGNCDSLVLMGCYENNSTYHPRMAGAQFTDQTPGDTLWVRIWENSNNDIGKLKICVGISDTVHCPAVFEVSGGGTYCPGDAGKSVTLSGSELGIQYTLLLNDTLRLDTLEGDGSSLMWSSLLEEGVYRIEAEYTVDSCVVVMYDSAVIERLDLPELYVISGGGTFYPGDSGVVTTLSGSEPGVEYTLLLNDTIRLDTLAGTGTTMDWSLPYQEGVYRVSAEYPPDGCAVVMADSAVVMIREFPIQFLVSGGGSFCRGDTGVSILLSGSETGIQYTLLLNDTIRMDTLLGDGSALSWSPVQVEGVYRIEGEYPPADSAVFLMSDSAVIDILELPHLSALPTHITCFEENDGTITLQVNAAAPFVAEWSGPGGYSSNELQLNDLVPGDYSAVVTDSNQCVTVSQAITITEPDLLVATVDSISHLSSYESNDGSIELSIAGGTTPYQVLWTGTDEYSSLQEDPDSMTVGYYRVRVTDNHLCMDSIRDIRIILDEDPEELFIPEGFSPNGDGYNDLFVILGLEQYPDNELMIFNRQGVTVLHRVNYRSNWDGSADMGGVMGGELPEGTYYYILRFGTSGLRKGYVYINRE